jgi:hypothetical protein
MGNLQKLIVEEGRRHHRDETVIVENAPNPYGPGQETVVIEEKRHHHRLVGALYFDGRALSLLYAALTMSPALRQQRASVFLVCSASSLARDDWRRRWWCPG